MQCKSLFARIAAAILGLTVTSIGPPTWAEGNAAAQPMELRRIMRELGSNMQEVTEGISREDWERVAKTAPKIAEHRQPPIAEKMRILAFAGSNAGAFRAHDERVHDAALAMEKAAAGRDGKRVIAAFAKLQGSCLACHEAFRSSFMEHFYGIR